MKMIKGDSVKIASSEEVIKLLKEDGWKEATSVDKPAKEIKKTTKKEK